MKTITRNKYLPETLSKILLSYQHLEDWRSKTTNVIQSWVTWFVGIKDLCLCDSIYVMLRWDEIWWRWDGKRRCLVAEERTRKKGADIIEVLGLKWNVFRVKTCSTFWVIGMGHLGFRDVSNDLVWAATWIRFLFWLGLWWVIWEYQLWPDLLNVLLLSLTSNFVINLIIKINFGLEWYFGIQISRGYIVHG